MDVRAQLSPFVKTLRREAMLHTVAWGCAAAALSVAAYFLVLHFGFGRPVLHTVILLACAAFLVVGGIAYLRRAPSLAQTARRIDALGLEERISTMVEYQSQDGVLIDLQRKDAQEHLSKLSPTQLQCVFPKRAILLLLVFSLLAAGIHLVPYDLFAPVSPERVMSAEEQLARQMLSELRAKVESAALSDEERAALLAEIQALEEGMDGQAIGIDELAQITSVMGEMTEGLEELEEYVSWAFQLLKYECLQELGEAVLREDEEMIGTACTNMANRLLVMEEKQLTWSLMEISTSIEEALEQGEPTEDESYLCYIFAEFATDLKSAALYITTRHMGLSMVATSIERVQQRLLMYINSADILESAEGEKTGEDRYIRMTQEEMQEAFDAFESQTDKEDDAAMAALNEEARLLYSSNPNDWHGAGTGTRKEQFHAVTEKIYEPSLDVLESGYVPGGLDEQGNVWRMEAPEGESAAVVPYGQVYGTYYAALLDQLEAHSIPDSVLSAVEDYFYAME